MRTEQSHEHPLVEIVEKMYEAFNRGDMDTIKREVFAENIPRDQIGPVLQPLLEHYREARRPAEGLGDFAAREGVASLRQRFGNESFVRPARPRRAAAS